MTRRILEELSALLDGELDPAQAAQLQAEIAADAALRAQYEQLWQVDAGLRAIAEQAGFVSEITLPASESRQAEEWSWSAIAAVAVALLLVRFLPKLLDLALLGVGIQLATAAAVCGLVVKWSREHRSRGAAAILRRK
jgi:anti-sigma factor RsiW